MGLGELGYQACETVCLALPKDFYQMVGRFLPPAPIPDERFAGLSGRRGWGPLSPGRWPHTAQRPLSQSSVTRAP